LVKSKAFSLLNLNAPRRLRLVAAALMEHHVGASNKSRGNI
jgi:hypothetical protein